MSLPPSLSQEMPLFVTGRMACACILPIPARKIVLTAKQRITAQLLQTGVVAGKNLAKN